MERSELNQLRRDLDDALYTNDTTEATIAKINRAYGAARTAGYHRTTGQYWQTIEDRYEALLDLLQETLMWRERCRTVRERRHAREALA